MSWNLIASAIRRVIRGMRGGASVAGFGFVGRPARLTQLSGISCSYFSFTSALPFGSIR